MFKTPEVLNQVKEFQIAFNNNVESKPTLSTEDRQNLRVDLIREELEELEEAIINNDIVEVADALCDLMYVVTGSVLEFGLGDCFKELFDEVHRSNMTKACKTLQEVDETIEWYQQEKGIMASYFVKGRYYIVYNVENDKTLKSKYYSPADLKSIIEKYSNQ